MLIYGAGGHAKVVLSILSACGVRVGGIFDDNWQGVDLSGHRILGGYNPRLMAAEDLIISVGDNYDRKRLVGLITHSFGTAIHPTAIIDPSVHLGVGTVIVHNVVVQANCCIGNHVIINTGAIIDHDCSLEDFVHVGPGATLCGGVRIGECTLVGAGSVVAPRVGIGKDCVIGAGAVVIRNVPDYAKVAGNPARVIC